MIDILTTPPHNAVEMAALILCWLTVAVIAYAALWLALYSLQFEGGFGTLGLVVFLAWGVYEYNYPDPNPAPAVSSSRVQPSQRVTAKPAEPRPLTDAEVGITPPPVRPRF